MAVNMVVCVCVVFLMLRFDLFCVVSAELRTEAVMQALAQNSKQPLIMPMSSKRTSAVVKPARRRHVDRASGKYRGE